MIEFRDFSFRYPGGDYALHNVNFKVEQGEFVLLAGDSGSGKSTLLRALNGLIPHFYSGEYCGKVVVYGLDPREIPPREISRYVGTVLQDPENQIVMSTVEREIAFPLENAGLKWEEIEKRVEDILDLIGINQLRDRKVDELSGGELQKVAIASAMAMHPRALLLDEPTSQLDPRSAEEILNLVTRFNEELGITVIMAEHRMENTLHRADRLIVLNRGEVVEDGEPRIIASRVDLDSLGVGYPQVSRIARMLGEEYLPLTVKEAWKTLGKKINPRDAKITAKGGDKIVELRRVSFSYGSRRVLEGIDLDIRRGEALGIIGRNGSGKTTLAKVIAGILEPQRGRVKYRIPKDSVGMVFQNPNLHVMGDSVRENLEYTLKARGENMEKVKRSLEFLRIKHVEDRNPMDLSGGEKLLMALGTVLVFQPDLLILDEPTRGLSWKHKMHLAGIIEEYKREHGVILISHDMELVAKVADRVALMSSGRIVLEGSTPDMLSGTLTFSTQVNKLANLIAPGSRALREEDVL